jgi:hypothetical protein
VAGLPKTFSKLQVSASADPTQSPRTAPKVYLPTPSSLSTPNPGQPGRQVAISRFPSAEFNSFYKIEAVDETNNTYLNETYHVGIIDIFTPYSNRKRTEHFVKSLVTDGRTISAVDPKMYRQRFVEFIQSIVIR